MRELCYGDRSANSTTSGLAGTVATCGVSGFSGGFGEGVKDPDSDEWIMLIQTVTIGQELDGYSPDALKGGSWRATVEEKFERLLRETQIPVGLLWNGVALRLVYAPRGESSGHVTFPIDAMTEVAGRSIVAALDAVLGAGGSGGGCAVGVVAGLSDGRFGGGGQVDDRRFGAFVWWIDYDVDAVSVFAVCRG